MMKVPIKSDIGFTRQGGCRELVRLLLQRAGPVLENARGAKSVSLSYPFLLVMVDVEGKPRGKPQCGSLTLRQTNVAWS